MIKRKSDAATLRFYPVERGLYSIDLQGEPGAEGASLKGSINDAFAWMFVHTDALVLRGHIDAENHPCLAMIPHVPGYKIEYGEDTHIFTLTLARWAKAYGIEKALSEMRAAGQVAKADKLEPAARAGGSALCASLARIEQ